MRKQVMTMLIAGLLLMLAANAWAGPISKRFSEAEMARLKNGEILIENNIDPGGTKGNSLAWMVVKGTNDQFWKTIFDFEHYLEIYPRLKRVEVIKLTEKQSLVEFDMDATIDVMTYSVIGTLAEDRMRQDFNLDKSRPHKYFTSNEGYWLLEELEPGVLLVEYKVSVVLDLGVLSKVATKVVNVFAKDDLPEMMECTRKRIESGGTWTRNKK